MKGAPQAVYGPLTQEGSSRFFLSLETLTCVVDVVTLRRVGGCDVQSRCKGAGLCLNSRLLALWREIF